MDWNALTTRPELLVLVGVAVAALLLVWLRRRRAPGLAPLTPRSTVLEPAEIRLLERLREASGPEVAVWPRVHAPSAVELRADAPLARRRRARHLLLRQRFDFLLCNASDARPLAAIRIARAGRRRSAADLATLCGAARLPLLTLDPGEDYTIAYLREHLQWHMRGPGSHETPTALDGRTDPIIDLPPD